MTEFDDETQVWADPAWNHTRHAPRAAAHRNEEVGKVRSRPRVKRTRTHHVVAPRLSPHRQRVAGPATPVPFDHHADFDELDDLAPGVWGPVDHWVEPEDAGRRVATGLDPRLLRIGALAAAGTLMIPIALAIRVDRDDPMLNGATTTAPSSTVTVPGPPAAPVTSVTVTLPAPAPAPPEPAAAADGQSSASSAASATPAPVCGGTYTVIFNDFWNRFPKTSGATVEEWLAANHATLETPLYVGDELCIPAGATAPAPPTTEVLTTTAAPSPAPTVTVPAPTVPPTTAAPETTPAPVITNPPPPLPTGPPSAPSASVAAPAAAVVPLPAGSTPTPAQVEAMIREIWPDDIEDRAVAIAVRESGLDPTVHNFCCFGVFAIYFEMGRSWLSGLGVTSAEQLFDARTNVSAAYKLYTLSGWTPWRETDPGP